MLIAFLAVFALIALELALKLFSNKYIVILALCAFSHVCLISVCLPSTLSAAFIVLSAYSLIKILFIAPRKTETNDICLRIMYGGRTLVLASATALVINIPICVLLAAFAYPIAPAAVIADIILSAVFISLSAVTGAVRIFCTSRRLGITKRIILLLIAWIPVINLIYAAHCCKFVRSEYFYEIDKAALQSIRASSEICKTKYPAVMLHGIGFRDYRYMNYWGRIPHLLKANGATVFYGNHDAFATIENSAEQIREQILSVCEQTGCDKVNIIAHSKGGLDARYMITHLNMAEHVASLTTMATPHRGSELIGVLNKLPPSVFSFIVNLLNKVFRSFGDKKPDAAAALHQLSASFCEKFNEKTPDMPMTYYQSYAARMGSVKSDGLLSIPYALMCFIGGKNDGLVSVDSAKWGHFRGTLSGKSTRGISHSDLIDLKRQDYEGFDISEVYVEILSYLREMGY